MSTTAHQPSTTSPSPAAGPTGARSADEREHAVVEHLLVEAYAADTEQAFADLAARHAPAADPQRYAAFEAELADRAAARTPHAA
ncbi:hypothetical protein ACIGZJ_30860 [Kitasatospora sp. NPDC052868]|uniref:hypothetical protein n=1 Tax=Kitasatospora sp. NPDC052868 TaxID=3364060 RepID=UPI0037CBF9E8